MSQEAPAAIHTAAAERLRAGGTVPPMITPLTPDRSVDAASLARFGRALEDAGVAGLLALGSTGEGPHLGPDASEAVVGTLTDAVTIPVIVNVAAISTEAAVEAARRAKAAGADIVLAPPPSGYPLAQDELARHFETVADAAGEPVLAYHVPVRVPTAVSPGLVADLVGRGVLLGVKDSSGDLDNHRRTAKALAGAGLLLTGSETCVDLAVQAGFAGSVPGLANLYPRTEAALVSAARAGRREEARALQERVVDFMQVYVAPAGEASFTATALGALKLALVSAGIIEHPHLTAPFAEPSTAVARHVAAHLAAHPAEF